MTTASWPKAGGNSSPPAPAWVRPMAAYAGPTRPDPQALEKGYRTGAGRKLSRCHLGGSPRCPRGSDQVFGDNRSGKSSEAQACRILRHDEQGRRRRPRFDVARIDLLVIQYPWARCAAQSLRSGLCHRPRRRAVALFVADNKLTGTTVRRSRATPNQRQGRIRRALPSLAAAEHRCGWTRKRAHPRRSVLADVGPGSSKSAIPSFCPKRGKMTSNSPACVKRRSSTAWRWPNFSHGSTKPHPRRADRNRHRQDAGIVSPRRTRPPSTSALKPSPVPARTAPSSTIAYRKRPTAASTPAN